MEVWFSAKNAFCTNQDSSVVNTCPQNIQKDQYFHHEKRSERSGPIKPTLYTKKLKNRLKTALVLNDDKMIVLVNPKKCSDEANFWCACELVISIPFTGHHNQARSSLHRGPRCAQTRPLLRIWQTRRFCAKYVTDQNDDSDCTRSFKASLEWYLSPGTGLGRF